MIKQLLFTPINNSQLIVFRIFFGLLMVAESWGAICTGWVKETFIEPEFTFTFMGFEWTQFMVGSFTSIPFFGSPIEFGYMYIHFFLMGVFGWGITFGYKYRFSAFAFAVFWTLCYFMQKSHYNNHYYLVVLMSWFMAIVPANAFKSIDSKRNPEIKTNLMYNWIRLFMIVQLGIVYTYAAVAKLYPGWWNGAFLKLRMSRSSFWFRQKGWDGFAEFLSNEKLALVLSWLGIGFDFLVVPLLLWKKTRNLAFFGALVFHLFNSITLHIGIFPYFALACCVFFYEPKLIEKLFFRKNLVNNEFVIPKLSIKKQKIILVGFFVYFIWQIYLPIRHWHIKDDVLWTEEGHRLSWRMMLRTKSANTRFYITDKKTNEFTRVKMSDYLTPQQIGNVRVKPDMMWQFAKKLKRKYQEEGKDIKVTVKSRLGVNGGPTFYYINDTMDIANKDWKYFGHQDWLLPAPKDYFNRDEKSETRR